MKQKSVFHVVKLSGLFKEEVDMVRVKKIIKILFLLVYSQLVFGQSSQQLIKSENFIYTLETPKDWLIDSSIKDLAVAYHPKSASWYDATSIMYVNVIPNDEAESDMFNIIDYDLDNYYINSPQLKVEYGEKLNFNNGDFVSMVIYLSGANEGKGPGHSLAVAYIPQFKEVMNVVLSSETREDFERNLPVFKSLVASYNAVNSGYAVSTINTEIAKHK